jgi:hypothetical protein
VEIWTFRLQWMRCNHSANALPSAIGAGDVIDRASDDGGLDPEAVWSFSQAIIQEKALTGVANARWKREEVCVR